MAKQDDYSRITLRLPAELHERLVDAAGAKSLNAEVVERLEDSFAAPDAYKAAAEEAAAKFERSLQIADLHRRDYRMLASQIALMRHLIQRVIDAGGDMPPDLQTIIELLALKEHTSRGRPLTAELLKDALEATEQAAHLKVF